MKNKNFFEALKHAAEGILTGFKTQWNIKTQILIAIMVIIAGMILKLTKIEMLFVVFAIALVLIAEMLNTAIESVVDLVTEEFKEKAKVAKDVGAGAVLIASINAIIVAIIIIFI